MAVDELSPEEKADARAVFAGDRAETGDIPCVHCAGIHDRVTTLAPDRQPCPRVKRAVWSLDGILLEVEYWPGKWDDGAEIIRPADVYDDDVESLLGDAE
jgi:hypothetical protein